MYNICTMSIITNDYTNKLFNSVSFGYYGQKPAGRDYPEELKKNQFTPQEPETYIELCKRYVWTILPLMTLVKPVGSVVTVVSEMARIAKSVDLMMKHRTLQSVSYNAFKTALSAGTIAATVIEPFSPFLRRLFTGIQLLSLAHQTTLKLYRYKNNNDDGDKLYKLATHILCNSVAMFLLFSQNPYVIYSFFVLQCATAFEHAILQLSKRNYLAASVDAIMGSVRFIQAYQVISQIPALQARIQLQRFQRIDSREPIKQQLTRHEERLKNLGGEEYLYFKQNGPEEKFLILTAEADHNEGLDPVNIASLINQLSKRFDVKFRTISAVKDISREIQSATQFGRVTGLMLFAHGSSTGITLSDDLKNGRLTAETISPDLFSGLDPRCVLALWSCSTASDSYSSVAYRVANLSQRVTFAPNDVVKNMTLKQLDPLEFSFEEPGKSVKTVKIQPLEFEKPGKPAKIINIQPLEDDSFIKYFLIFE